MWYSDHQLETCRKYSISMRLSAKVKRTEDIDWIEVKFGTYFRGVNVLKILSPVGYKNEVDNNEIAGIHRQN